MYTIAWISFNMLRYTVTTTNKHTAAALKHDLEKAGLQVTMYFNGTVYAH